MPALKNPRLTDALSEKLRLLPKAPGCYLFRDGKGDILYVGKALVLRNRVRSYFQESTKHGIRIARLVQKVCDVEWMVVDSELEALVLECNLIKLHRPPFNVRLRDDKSYPYITITRERFPRVLFTRRLRKDGARYFGPYTSAWAVRDTLQVLHKVFPLIPCGKSWSGRPEQRPCLYYHLNQCLGPCAGLSDPNKYRDIVDQVDRFLSGKQDTLVEDMEGQMEAAAEALDFERAAQLRDRLSSIEAIREKQKVLSDDQEDRDVIAVVKDERGSAIQMLYVRGGKLIGQRHFVLDGSSDTAPTEAVQEFVKQYYSDTPDLPREILLPVEIEERKIVQTWLRGRKGAAVSIEVPQGGEKLRLVEMAAANAEQALNTIKAELDRKEAWAEASAVQLQESLGLPALPVRVEGYDISNIQGMAPVGSMVVVEAGEAAKAEYRRFKIRYHPESPNDFAMMHEVITRRLRAFLDGDEKFIKLPDLIMIDGGKGQLGAALKARDELGLTVPMIGLAKKMELIFVPIAKNKPVGSPDDTPPATVAAPEHQIPAPELNSPEEVKDAVSPAERADEVIEPSELATPKKQRDREYSYQRPAPLEYAYEAVELPLNAPGLMLLRKLRDEAHRFALTYHRKIRDKRLHGSALEEIPGVGPRRKRLLLRTFGSVEGIRRATVEEIAAVPTMTKTLASQIRDYLQVG